MSNFIVLNQTTGAVNNSSGTPLLDPATGLPAQFTITAPTNGESAQVYGLEAGIQQSFRIAATGRRVASHARPEEVKYRTNLGMTTRNELRYPLLLMLMSGAFATAHADETPGPAYVPYHASGIYALGETAGWNVTLPWEAAPATYVIRKNNLMEIGRGTVQPGRPAKIEARLDEPGMPIRKNWKPLNISTA